VEAGVLKLKGCRGKAANGLCPICDELEDTRHVIFCCGESACETMNLNVRNV
jgi:hypothetical protein